MQMREHHVRHVTRLHPERLEAVGQPSLAVIENLALDRAQPVADSGVDQNRGAAAHYQRAGEIEPDAVAVVGRMVALPQLARHNAEHASAVVAPQPVAEHRDLEFTDPDFFH